MNNGTLLEIINFPGCAYNGINACGHILADINGQKGPNMWGKDLYAFWIVKKNGIGKYSILPSGTKGENPFQGCTELGTTAGGCTAVRLATPELMP